ncbi:MAG: invasion associated locus B family protein [Emcibacter sp.]|nr:invasion associated locus B family protein [Emcibacter sp.]
MSYFRSLKLVSIVSVLTISVLSGTEILAQTKPVAPSTTSDSAPANNARLIASNWNVECQPDAIARKMECELSYAVKVGKTGQLFTRIAIGATPHRMVLQLPHGLDLKSGIQLQVDEDPVISLAYTTSNKLGIFSSNSVSDTLLSAMQKGAKMKLTFSAMGGKKITIPVSLIGFSLAVEKLE